MDPQTTLEDILRTLKDVALSGEQPMEEVRTKLVWDLWELSAWIERGGHVPDFFKAQENIR